jgi:hypothetical protein
MISSLPLVLSFRLVREIDYGESHVVDGGRLAQGLRAPRLAAKILARIAFGHIALANDGSSGGGGGDTMGGGGGITGGTNNSNSGGSSGSGGGGGGGGNVDADGHLSAAETVSDGVDVVGRLAVANERDQLIVTLPWVVEFIREAARCAPRLACWHDHYTTTTSVPPPPPLLSPLPPPPPSSSSPSQPQPITYHYLFIARCAPGLACWDQRAAALALLDQVYHRHVAVLLAVIEERSGGAGAGAGAHDTLLSPPVAASCAFVMELVASLGCALGDELPLVPHSRPQSTDAASTSTPTPTPAALATTVRGVDAAHGLLVDAAAYQECFGDITDQVNGFFSPQFASRAQFGAGVGGVGGTPMGPSLTAAGSTGAPARKIIPRLHG